MPSLAANTYPQLLQSQSNAGPSVQCCSRAFPLHSVVKTLQKVEAVSLIRVKKKKKQLSRETIWAKNKKCSFKGFKKYLYPWRSFPFYKASLKHQWILLRFHEIDQHKVVHNCAVKRKVSIVSENNFGNKILNVWCAFVLCPLESLLL